MNQQDCLLDKSCPKVPYCPWYHAETALVSSALVFWWYYHHISSNCYFPLTTCRPLTGLFYRQTYLLFLCCLQFESDRSIGQWKPKSLYSIVSPVLTRLTNLSTLPSRSVLNDVEKLSPFQSDSKKMHGILFIESLLGSLFTLLSACLLLKTSCQSRAAAG